MVPTPLYHVINIQVKLLREAHSIYVYVCIQKFLLQKSISSSRKSLITKLRLHKYNLDNYLCEFPLILVWRLQITYCSWWLCVTRFNYVCTVWKCAFLEKCWTLKNKGNIVLKCKCNIFTCIPCVPDSRFYWLLSLTTRSHWCLSIVECREKFHPG